MEELRWSMYNVHMIMWDMHAWMKLHHCFHDRSSHNYIIKINRLTVVLFLVSHPSKAMSPSSESCFRKSQIWVISRLHTGNRKNISDRYKTRDYRGVAYFHVTWHYRGCGFMSISHDIVVSHPPWTMIFLSFRGNWWRSLFFSSRSSKYFLYFPGSLPTYICGHVTVTW